MHNRKGLGILIFILCMMGLFVLPVHAASNAAVTVKTESGKSFLYNTSTDEKVTGYTGITQYPSGSNYYYYFISKKGQIYAGKLFKTGGKIYCAFRDGHLARAGVTINGNRYYFDKKTFAAYIGWKKIGKSWYYFKKNAIKATEWLTIGTNTYYMDPNANGKRVTGWQTIDGKAYYFNSTGILQKGLVTIGGKIYYLNPKKNGARTTGWVTINGNKYYFSKKASRIGQAVTGWGKISKNYYYFNDNGIMQKGWLTIGQKRYYLDPTTGKRVTGTKVINGTSYDFGTAGYIKAEPTGPWSIRINKGTCVVTIYRGTTPVKALRCSVGNPTSLTPNGTFYLGIKHRWWELFGGVYGQFTTQITGNILFHSVFYRVNGNNRTLYTNEYNKLGSPASHGCVRLNVAGAKYIYDNCPSGTKVTIFYGTSSDDPLGKPAHITATGSYDPTDPYL